MLLNVAQKAELCTVWKCILLASMLLLWGLFYQLVLLQEWTNNLHKFAINTWLFCIYFNIKVTKIVIFNIPALIESHCEKSVIPQKPVKRLISDLEYRMYRRSLLSKSSTSISPLIQVQVFEKRLHKICLHSQGLRPWTINFPTQKKKFNPFTCIYVPKLLRNYV